MEKPLIGVLFIAYNQTEPERKHLTGSAIGVKQCFNTVVFSGRF